MMKKQIRIGVLAYQGDVAEHIQATQDAGEKLNIKVIITPVRTKDDIVSLDALVIPGGESTTLQTLSQKEGIFDEIKKIRYIFGTCAGSIMLARTIQHKAEGQETLELTDIEIDRNAYGRQAQSFIKKINTRLGRVEAVFIRAPRIKSIGKNVNILATNGQEIIACEEKIGNKLYLAACFHPELTTTKFHEYFLENVR